MAIFSNRAGRTAMVVLTDAAVRRLAAEEAATTNLTTSPTETSTGTSATGASSASTAPDTGVVVRASLGAAAAYVVALLLSILVDKGELDGTTIGEGFVVLTLFYVFAQTIERLLEPFSNLIQPTADEAIARDKAVRDAKNDAASETKANAAAEAQAKLDKKRANRAVTFWGISTALGFLAAASMKAYFLTTLGVAAPPRWAEILVTGAVIGGGTKPLHDLITRIEKKKEQEQDPSEVATGS